MKFLCSALLFFVVCISNQSFATVNTYECHVGNSYSSGPIYRDLTVNTVNKSINFMDDGIVAKDQSRPSDIKNSFIKYENIECGRINAQWGCKNVKLSGKRDPITHKIIKAVRDELYVSEYVFKRASKAYLIVSRTYEDGSHGNTLQKCTLKY